MTAMNAPAPTPVPSCGQPVDAAPLPSSLLLALRILGALWALPCSLFGALLALALRCAFLIRTETTTLVFTPTAGSWFEGWMRRNHWAGFSCGDTIVLRLDVLAGPHGKTCLAHELRHTAQVHVFGILVLVVWPVLLVVGAVRSWRTLYLNHPMERDARRSAGELVTVAAPTLTAEEP